MTGYTASTDFPTQAPIFSTISSNIDVFVAKINPAGDGLVYSTYLGGNNTDIGMAIALKPVVANVSSANNKAQLANSTGYAAYITGYTFSTDFPTQSPPQANSRGGWDAFVTKINASGSALDFSTYIGGLETDVGMDIDIDSEGTAYAVGYTYSFNFPFTQNPIQTVHGGGADGFLSMLDIGNLSTTGRQKNVQNVLVKAQFPLGGSGDEFCAVVKCSDPWKCCVGVECHDGVTDWPPADYRLDTTIGSAPPDCTFALFENLGEDTAKCTHTFLCGDENPNTPICVDEVYPHGDPESKQYLVCTTRNIENGTESFTSYSLAVSDLIVADVLSTYAMEGNIYDSIVYQPQMNGGTGEFDIISAGRAFNPPSSTNSDSLMVYVTPFIIDAELIDFMRTTGSNSYNSTLYYLGGTGYDVAYSLALGIDGSVYFAGATNSNDFPTLSFQDEYGGNVDGIVAKYCRAYTLTVSTTSGGTTYPEAGSSIYCSGTEVWITAYPETGYVFWKWTGDVAGSNNPVLVVVDSDKTVTANFVQIAPPLNFAGQKVLNRSLFRAEYINNLTWTANPASQNIDKYRIYLIDGDTQSLVAEVNAGTTSYMHRNVDGNKAYTYAIQAVNSDGLASALAYATVQ